MKANCISNLPANPASNVTAIGVGSAGCRIISELNRSNKFRDRFLCISCDEEDLKLFTGECMLIPLSLSTGRSSPSHVRGAGIGHTYHIRSMVTDSKLVLIFAGLGGNVGSGLSPLIAQICREMEIVTVGVFIMPFRFEKNKLFYAGTSLRKLRDLVDALVLIDNDELLEKAAEMPILDAYAMINESISSALDKIIQGSNENEGTIGLRKFIKTVVGGGYSILSIGRSSSINRAEDATVKAVHSICQSAKPDEASNAILHLDGDRKLSINEIATAVNRASSLLGDSALQIHYGLSTNGSSNLTAILVARGFKNTKFNKYDPLAEALHGLEIDDCLDVEVQFESPNLKSIE